jgi:hypothetical protein
MKSISTFNAMPARRNLSVYAAAVVAKLKDLAPYAVIVLVVPGGSLMALLLWLYRQQKGIPVFPDSRDSPSSISLRWSRCRGYYSS